MQNSKFKIIFISLTLTEVLSFVAHSNRTIMEVSFFAILAIVFILALWRLEYSMYFLLAELFLGGKGYLLAFGGISIRIAIFCVIIGAWAGKMLVERKKPNFLKGGLFKYYLALSVFILLGIANGFLRGNGFQNILLDANAWIYFLTVFPLYEVIKEERHLRNILEIFFAAIAVISFKTISLFLIFAHSGFSLIASRAGDAGVNYLASDIYKWIRNSGAGEITQFDGFYRIFLQSQVFVMIGFFILLWLLPKKRLTLFFTNVKKSVKWRIEYIMEFVLLSMFSATLFISFSRSFWVGLAAGSSVFLWFLFKKNKEISQLAKITFLLKSSFAVITGIAFVFVIAPGIFGASRERISAGAGDAASASRMILLPKLLNKIGDNFILGSGFGATVAYETKDPRQLQLNPDGKYTTYAFEWGYLDIWIKIGFFGLLAYLLLIFKIFIAEFKKSEPNFGLLCGLAALCIINVFSPYLNHPLGIGSIILIGLIGQVSPIEQKILH